ncbi:nuclease-related domain-containing protein [Thalassoporum mexicanum]|uniref:nuclease-related domain-containing protein n=1 Tax=Thalassoporum mexicanum TaxID=3457544 RepID=UPI0002E1D4A4|nr:nuclease-related domain-containing protein [Pseudanabaena sp. PCC 7367]
MQVFTTRDLEPFEQEVARHLASLDNEGYVLIGFSFYNYGPVAINGLLISDDGVVCGLEIAEQVGTWTGSLNNAWQANGREIKCTIANNPLQQVRQYALIVRDLLRSKMNRYVPVSGLIVVPTEADISVAGVAIDRCDRSNPIGVVHLPRLSSIIDEIRAAFTQPYEVGKAERLLYALTDLNEDALYEGSTRLANAVIKVRKDIQGQVSENKGLTDQILSELISLRETIARIEAENRRLNDRLAEEMIAFKTEAQEWQKNFTSQIASDFVDFQGELKEQNDYLIKQLSAGLAAFKNEMGEKNNQLDGSVRTLTNDLRGEVGVLIARVDRQTEELRQIKAFMTRPKWWQRLFRWLFAPLLVKKPTKKIKPTP